MKALNSIKFIVLLIGSMTPPARALCQTVSWTSSDETVATADETGLVTPVSAGTVTITATVEQNGKTVTSSKTVEVSLTPPPITVNGVKWARGNLVGTDCTNGICSGLTVSENPYERGLYFQWGGDGAHVIGYPKGGDTTTGTAGNAWNNCTPEFPCYVQPGASFPGSWFGESTTVNVYHSYGTTKGNWTVNNPCTLAVGGWRMPTKAELEYTHPSGTASGATSPSITGWTYSSSNGGYLQHTATGLILPVAGYRGRSSNPAMYGQSTYGYYWSSTEYNASYTYMLYLRSSGLDVTNEYYKSDAYPARCVKD